MLRGDCFSGSRGDVSNGRDRTSPRSPFGSFRLECNHEFKRSASVWYSRFLVRPRKLRYDVGARPRVSTIGDCASIARGEIGGGHNCGGFQCHSAGGVFWQALLVVYGDSTGHRRYSVRWPADCPGIASRSEGFRQKRESQWIKALKSTKKRGPGQRNGPRANLEPSRVGLPVQKCWWALRLPRAAASGTPSVTAL